MAAKCLVQRLVCVQNFTDNFEYCKLVKERRQVEDEDFFEKAEYADEVLFFLYDSFSKEHQRNLVKQHVDDLFTDFLIFGGFDVADDLLGVHLQQVVVVFDNLKRFSLLVDNFDNFLGNLNEVLRR